MTPDERRMWDKFEKQTLEERGLEAFESTELFEKWLHSEIKSLGNVTPNSLLNSEEGKEKVMHVLAQIILGIY